MNLLIGLLLLGGAFACFQTLEHALDALARSAKNALRRRVRSTPTTTRAIVTAADVAHNVLPPALCWEALSQRVRERLLILGPRCRRQALCWSELDWQLVDALREQERAALAVLSWAEVDATLSGSANAAQIL